VLKVYTGKKFPNFSSQKKPEKARKSQKKPEKARKSQKKPEKARKSQKKPEKVFWPKRSYQRCNYCLLPPYFYPRVEMWLCPLVVKETP
jgi:hypothetical protein